MPTEKVKRKETLLGQGSFGCVFQPKLPCVTKEVPFPSKAKKIPNINQVSKIFISAEDFDMEMKKSAFAAKVDPKGKHMLLPTSSCQTDRKTVESASSVVDQCDALVESVYNESKKLYQINMPYGGHRIDKYLKINKKDRPKFLQDMLAVFEAIVKLTEIGICHQDIKPSNMLYTPEGKVIIIDYSLMVPLNDVYHADNLRVLRHSYMPYPPEYKIFHLFYKKVCQGTAKDNGECPYYKEVQETLKSFGSDKYENYRNYHDTVKDDLYLKDMYDWTVKKKNNLKSAYAIFAEKVDVYSVGMSMIMVDKSLDTSYENPNFTKKYKKLLMDMTHVNPMKRIDARTTLKRVQKILKIV